jgi:integrase
MGRHQRGYLYEANNAIHVRYYCLEMIDGQEVRKQRSHRLADKNEKYHSTTCKAVRLLCEDFLREVNAQVSGQVKADIRIVDFFDHTYLPFVREHKRHSTAYQYEQLFEGKLRSHFGTRTLSEYKPSDGYKFLMSLKVKVKLNRNSLFHVRSLASGIFSHAVNLGLIDQNPWKMFRWQEGGKAEPTVAYTLDQSLAILKALSSRTDAALIFACASFLGMRPSEICGLRWENVADDCLWIRGSVVRGRPDETKTPQSVRQLPLISPVRELMAGWREQCMNPVEGWLFQNAGRVINLDAFSKHHLKPVVVAAGLEWHGLYAGRRGAATNLVALTGSVSAAYQVLGNSLAVVMQKYIKPDQSQGLAGLKMLEAAATNGKGEK